MVFPSVPVFVDPPNWNLQQQAHQLGSSSCGGGDEALQLPPPPPGLVGGAPLAPGPIAERARLAKTAPRPEQALKCPRCNSTNTKFCYFNNYSLSQPRHFCKACRRYWTRGGALRNIPVGGGCRRNKRAKSGGSSGSSSKSSVTSRRASSSSAIAGATTSTMITLPPPPLPNLTSLHPVHDCSSSIPNLGLSYAGIQSLDAVDYYQMRGGSGSSGGNLKPHWQIQQLPLILGGLMEPPPPPPPQTPPLAPLPSLHPSFLGEGIGFEEQLVSGQAQKLPSSGLLMQLASVKMEDNAQQLSLPRQILGGYRSDLFWAGGGGAGGSSNSAGWAADFSWFNSSSTDSFP